MKKLFIVFVLIFALFGCTNNENSTKSTDKGSSDNHVAVAKSNKSSSLEEKINTIIDKQDKEDFSNSKDIIDYEIKGKYIFVLTHNKLRNFFVIILKNDSNELKWVTTVNFNDAPAEVAPTKNGPFMFIIPTKEQDVKGVTIFGQPAKLIKTTQYYSKDYKQEINCWIYVTDSIGKSIEDYNPNKDIKYIK